VGDAVGDGVGDGVGAGVGALVGATVAHTLFEVAVGAVSSYWPPPSLLSQTVMVSHSRFEVRVGAWDWYSVTASHALTAPHCLFAVAVGATDSNCFAVHAVSGSHTESPPPDGAPAPALAWPLAMKNPGPHCVRFVQLRSEYRVAGVDS
jgi:hypothetical protein